MGRLERLISLDGGSRDRLYIKELLNLPRGETELLSFLENERKSIELSKYMNYLSQFQYFNFAQVDQKELPDDWLRMNNRKLIGEVDCFKMKDLLFKITGFEEEKNRHYIFEEVPKEKGFFMGSLI